MKNALLPMLVYVLAIGCSNKSESYRISAPGTVEPGQSANVAVSGSFDPGVRILGPQQLGISKALTTASLQLSLRQKLAQPRSCVRS